MSSYLRIQVLSEDIVSSLLWSPLIISDTETMHGLRSLQLMLSELLLANVLGGGTVTWSTKHLLPVQLLQLLHITEEIVSLLLLLPLPQQS